MSNLLKMMAGAGIAAPLYVDDVFSAYTYTGNGGTQVVTTGVDADLVWVKSRSAAGNHILLRGSNDALITNQTQGNLNSTSYGSLSTTGFTVANGDSDVCGTGVTYVSWSFAQAAKFFKVATVTKSAGSNATVSFTGLGTIGMVAVKRTDDAGSWYVWHRSLTAGKLLYLNTTAAEATLGHITVSGTTVTLVNGVIADGTYIVYAWAHDTASDGIIQCGSYTGNANASGQEINLNWETQFVIIKPVSHTGYWEMFDTMRGMSNATNSALLNANLSDAEYNNAIRTITTSTGFRAGPGSGNGDGVTYIYLAIRRPNKPPTVGTQVYNAIARTGTGAAATVTGVGFAPDLVITKAKNSADVGSYFVNRLVGGSNYLSSADTSSEAGPTTVLSLDKMDGVGIGTLGLGFNGDGTNYINWFFRRAPGFFDEVCYTGDGANPRVISHNLTVIPELLIAKVRSTTGYSWYTYFGASFNQEAYLDLTDASGASSDITARTASTFTQNSASRLNTAGQTYVAYLFATLAGISKCFAFTGNGTNQNIECGFTTGARFVLLKRTDSTGNWLVADTVRGLVSGNDPSLALNSTAAEVTTIDWIDPYAGGFNIVQEATNNANVNNATYIGFAVA